LYAIWGVPDNPVISGEGYGSTFGSKPDIAGLPPPSSWRSTGRAYELTVPWFLFRFFNQNSNPAIKAPRARTPTPAPMPAVAPVLSPPAELEEVTMTVTGGAVTRLLDAISDTPSSPLTSETVLDALSDREVMTEVGSAATAGIVVVCRAPGQAAVVYIGAMMQEFELPSATWYIPPTPPVPYPYALLSSAQSFNRVTPVDSLHHDSESGPSRHIHIPARRPSRSPTSIKQLIPRTSGRIQR